MAFARKMLSNFVNRLRQDRSGVAVIEFAYSLPILMVLGVTGAETAYYVQTQQQISQIALAAADNASRVGEAGVLQTRRVYESDINDIFLGAPKQFGDPNFFDNARIIISSVEYDADDNIYIHWQRCMAKKMLIPNSAQKVLDWAMTRWKTESIRVPQGSNLSREAH